MKKRHIKFRVWDMENKTYHYLPYTTSFQVFINSYNPMISIEKLGNLLYPWNEIQEWTGVHDVKGREIYEGDIVKANPGVEFEVAFVDGSFVLEFGEGHHTLAGAIARDWKLEIVGNIYEYNKSTQES